MDDQLARNYQRWQDADARGRDEEADGLFAEVFQTAVRPPQVSNEFTLRTVEAIATAAARDRVRARRVRTMLVPAAIAGLLAGLYFGAGWLGAAVSAAVVSAVNLMIGAVVAGAAAVEAGPDGWSVMTSLGRAAAATIANPAVTATNFAIQGFAITALIVLRRLLGSDRESL